MKKVYFESEKEAMEFFSNLGFTHTEILFLLKKAKHNGYIQKSKIEIAEDLIEERKSTGYKMEYYKQNKEIIDKHIEEMNILIDGFNQLKELTGYEKA
jgi:predicted nucleic acid-binding protein